MVGRVTTIESGPIAIAQIFAAHLALAALLLVPIAVAARDRGLAVAIAVVVVAATVRFGGEWTSMLAPESGTQGSAGSRLDVVSWNLELSSRPAEDSVAFLRDHPADLVALQELTPDVASAIELDAALTSRYPNRVLLPRPGITGLGILSSMPLVAGSHASDPSRQEATVTAIGTEIVVVNAHPLPSRIKRVAETPIHASLDPTDRNHSLDVIRREVDAVTAGGRHVLLIGDFNTAPTEPAFGRLVGGLRDAHSVAGFGPGWTWRPDWLEFLGAGLLRIDLVLTSPEIQPLAIGSACPPIGDHCLVRATLQLPG